MNIDAERLWADFEAICDCGGRQSGTPSERAARSLLQHLGQEASGVAVQAEAVTYIGWEAKSGSLTLGDGTNFEANPLLLSIATQSGGLHAEVIDLGRGTHEEFAAHVSEIPGRIVLVRHELMFAAGTVHRRIKYRAAVEAGAVGFLIAGPLEGSSISGSSGRGDEPGIPAAGISPEVGRALARTSAGWPKVVLNLDCRSAPAESENLIFEIPGQSNEWIVLSAHIDGHSLAESALDNATGLAVALEVTRALASKVGACKRGLRLAFFNVEEWALTGSDRHLANMSPQDRDKLAMNVNLDSIAGGEKLTALTSGFSGMEPFLLECAESVGRPLGLFRPLQMNSDHGNFAQMGIPAFRLVAGFGDACAHTRLVLTNADRRNLAKPEELSGAAELVLEIVSRALDCTEEMAQVWRARRME